jgi:hypothetical protein
MRSRFPGHFRPTQEEFKSLWAECTFAFDANVLLNLYRYSPSTRNEFLSLLKKLRSRAWLPHQAASEYLDNRLGVISSQEDAYELLATLIRSVPAKVEAEFRGQYPKHALIEIDKVIDGLRKTAESASNAIREARKAHPAYGVDRDEVRDALAAIFDDAHVGAMDAPSDALAKAKVRFEQNLPPGTMDRGKGGHEQYGDAVLWLQLLDRAAASKKPLVFITDDRKVDWWQRHRGKTLGPLPELVQEMATVAGVKYYQYESAPFIERAAVFLKEKPAKNAVAEVRDVARALDASDFLAKEALRNLRLVPSALSQSPPNSPTYPSSLARLQDELRTLVPPTPFNLQEVVKAMGTSPLQDAMRAMGTSPIQEAMKAMGTSPLQDAMRGIGFSPLQEAMREFNERLAPLFAASPASLSGLPPSQKVDVPASPSDRKAHPSRPETPPQPERSSGDAPSPSDARR